MLEYLFKYAKFQYECGNYAAASICLFYYRNVVPQHDPNYLNALYGKLASEILNQEWTHAKDDLTKLKAYIDSDPFDTEVELLQHRAWLLHWSLFVFFNIPKGCDEIIVMFLTEQPYLNTIQVTTFRLFVSIFRCSVWKWFLAMTYFQILCPHLLRYLAVAVVTSKSKQKSSLKDLTRVIDVVGECLELDLYKMSNCFIGKGQLSRSGD
jgi:translation initiation factor 3 subunit E